MLERRACTRFMVPGCTVSYRVQRSLFRTALQEEGCPIADLGKGGLSFLTDKKLAVGTKIFLMITVSPKDSPLEIKGTVVHSGLNRSISYKHVVGVAFDPFGAGSSNTVEALNELARIEETFSPARP